MFQYLTPGFYVWLARGIHASPYIFLAMAIYWSNYLLLIPAAPVLYLQLSTFIPAPKWW